MRRQATEGPGGGRACWPEFRGREGEEQTQRENEHGKGEKVGREGRRGRGSEGWKILEARMDMKADDKGWKPVRKHGEGG